MATRVVHFGQDVCSRAAVLGANGFAVTPCGRSIVRLNQSLRQGGIDAVLIEERGLPKKVDLVSIVRSHDWAPLVLFQGPTRKFDPFQFELAIPEQTPQKDWLAAIQQLVERSHAVIAMSNSLIAQSAELREQVRQARLKLRAERIRSRASRLRSQQNLRHPSSE